MNVIFMTTYVVEWPSWKNLQLILIVWMFNSSTLFWKHTTSLGELINPLNKNAHCIKTLQNNKENSCYAITKINLRI